MPRRESEKYTLDPVRVAVLGAGHAGRGLASYLALHGIDVSIYNRTFKNVKKISEKRGIDVHGLIEANAYIPLITDDMSAAVADRDIIIITVPAQAHPFFARTLGPHLEPGQTVLLMPGRTGGALEFERILRSNERTDDILLGEAQTFSFVSRIMSQDSVMISKIKNSVKVSSFPACDNPEFIRSLNRLPLALELAEDVMETSLNNIGAMLHPTPTILCAGLLESREGGYNHYHDAISQTVGRLVEKMDAERVRVAREFSVDYVSVLEWLRTTYGAKGATLCECIRSIDAYDGIGSPSSLKHRYVLEDVPTGLVPIACLGRLAEIPTPAIDSVVNIACQLYEYAFWEVGRNLESLALDGMSPREVKEYVRTGVPPVDYPDFHEMLDIYGLEVDDT
ncbi:MAG: NAD/NADP octopine/nopaline dehydrogenase family protein [Candidatus Thorarchaeota archaeon]|nr:MAG: NAD/NADP octopine/nopaline dehydrogenase family protein [Candidatus Thorarchaeota archaeon]